MRRAGGAPPAGRGHFGRATANPVSPFLISISSPEVDESPNFSGTWATRAGPAGRLPPFWGRPFVAASLTGSPSAPPAGGPIRAITTTLAGPHGTSSVRYSPFTTAALNGSFFPVW